MAEQGLSFFSVSQFTLSPSLLVLETSEKCLPATDILYGIQNEDFFAKCKIAVSENLAGDFSLRVVLAK